MINYDSPGMGTAFPRMMKPPTPPRTRVEPHVHNHLNNLPGLGGPHPRDHISPIAHQIAAQILNNHLNNPASGIAHAAQNGMLAGQATGQQALLNNLAGLGQGYQPVSLPSLPVGFQPPTNPFSRF